MNETKLKDGFWLFILGCHGSVQNGPIIRNSDDCITKTNENIIMASNKFLKSKLSLISDASGN